MLTRPLLNGARWRDRRGARSIPEWWRKPDVQRGSTSCEPAQHAVDLSRQLLEEKGPRRFYRHFLADLGAREKWAGHDPEHIRLLRVGARLMARQVKHCLLVSADQRRSID
jgi:hypothetical protein